MKIYETNKMLVEISEDTVKKTFKVHPKHATRYTLEKKALQRLTDKHGFPQLLATDDANTTIVMSKLRGANQEHLSDLALENLRSLVHNMLEAGVARHALPERDLLVTTGQEVNMVDFERITLRRFPWSPVWIVAKNATMFNLLRLINQHNPNLLSKKELATLATLTKTRSSLHVLKKVRTAFRKLWTTPSTSANYEEKFKSSKSHKAA